MALFGIYGKHTVDACPWNNIENAKILKAFAEMDIGPLAKKFKINKILGQYHTALEHTFLWIIDAEEADMPESKQSFGNKIKAIKNLMRVMFTKEPDMAAYERQQYFPQYMHGLKYAQENAEWVKIHENQTNK